MDVAVLAARIVLGVVFGLAGAAKLADRAGGRRALAGFGIPSPLAGPAAVLLPAAELAVAGTLIGGRWARPGAAAALGLLAAFSAVVAANRAAGRRTDCHCFGRLHSAPIGAATLARNGILAGLAAAVLADGPAAGGGAPLGAGIAAVAVAGVAIAVRFRPAGAAVDADAGHPVHADQTTAAGPPIDNEPPIHADETIAGGPPIGTGAPVPAADTTDRAGDASGAAGAGGRPEPDPLSRRGALALFGLAVVAALGLAPRATACGAQCRSSADCPGTCRNCKKQPGHLYGHCH